MKLQMDEGLIMREYEQAKNKNEQVKILADLNGCSVDEIMNVLIEHGAISGIPGAKKKKTEAVNWTPELDAEVSKLAREGLTQAEIGERLGISKQAIADRKRRLKLQAERLAGSFKKEKKERILPQTAPHPSAPHPSAPHPSAKADTFPSERGRLTKAKATPPQKEVCGVLRDIIGLLSEVGLKVEECSIDVLSRSFYISGVEACDIEVERDNN